MAPIFEKVKSEIIKAYSYQKRIDYYTKRKRKWNTGISFSIVIVSIVYSTIASIPAAEKASIGMAIIIAILTIIKEWRPILSQPEGELRDLDNIKVFYKNYQDELEKIFRKRIDVYNHKYQDKELDDDFCKISEEQNEVEEQVKMERLFKSLKDKEKTLSKNEAEAYFHKNFRGY